MSSTEFLVRPEYHSHRHRELAISAADRGLSWSITVEIEDALVERKSRHPLPVLKNVPTKLIQGHCLAHRPFVPKTRKSTPINIVGRSKANVNGFR